MKVTLICVGKIKERFYTDAIAEYSKRLSRYCKLDVIEVADEKTVENASENLEEQIREKEGKRIIDKIPADSYVICLSIAGKKYSSEKLAAHIQSLMTAGNGHITFIIGGSLGLSAQVLKVCKEELSFSDLTFPHQLMRVIFLEQLYRSFRIINNEPYHK